MFTFIRRIFDYNLKNVARYQTMVGGINKEEESVRTLRDEDFPKETVKLRERVKAGEHLDTFIPRAFALVREAARRTLGERHYDVQLIAGLALHEGKIAEQRTGEGKTLSATTSLYLNSLSGKGAHLVTVNDYLARRDAGWMGKVFSFLGVTTAAIISDKSFLYDPEFTDPEAQDKRLSHLRPCSRKQAYEADITYGINSEFGFDYLRDNMAARSADLVQRGFHYAIIDEADSVLIDEARTPHIISAPYDEDTSKYYAYAKVVNQLGEGEYIIDEKTRTANLTETGIRRVEGILGVSNIYEKDFDTLFHIEAALKARFLFKLNKEYIVKDGEIVIVDEFTGRLLQGRRFSEGIHQAIEAKENVRIQRESKTLATVSLQNYFRMYEKIAGMTGTAATEAEEFHKIYKTDVVVIPTHRPTLRNDYPDMIYKTEKGKYEALAQEIAQQFAAGRPVLVGTTSIEKNELLSQLLTRRGVSHEMLNAKNHEREAAILAAAGKKGAVTVATNMAGRGVDIILGGVKPDPQDKEYKEKIAKWQKEHDEVVALGGLYVLGTERHESRRIDNQLRGRSGRQGDPGETRFFVSLEDEMMRIFGGEQISNLMTFFKLPEDQPLSHSMVSRAMEQAQIKVEGFNFDIRKHLVDFDDVLNKQREIVYSLRRKTLHASEQGDVFKQMVFEHFSEQIQRLSAQKALFDMPGSTEKTDSGSPEVLLKEIEVLVPGATEIVGGNITSLTEEEMVKGLSDRIEVLYQERERRYGAELWAEVVKSVYLSTIDKCWTDHLTAIEDLREGINLRGYAQLDPLVEYKNEAFAMFERLMDEIQYETTRRLFRMEVVPVETQSPEGMQLSAASGVNPFRPEHIETPATKKLTGGDRPSSADAGQKKPQRNDPCWCGSGKKYKKCHYPQ